MVLDQGVVRLLVLDLPGTRTRRIYLLFIIFAIRSIIDADMARQQRVHGIFKDFLCYSKSIFVFRSSVNSIGTEGTVYKIEHFITA